jgi:hypothetical protein
MVKFFLDLFNKEFFFEWIEEQRKALEGVKEKISSTLVLKFLNLTKPFEVYIDVSDFLIEAIFMQDGHQLLLKIRSFVEHNYDGQFMKKNLCHGVLLQDLATLLKDT